MEWVLLRVAVAPATADPLADFLLAEGAPAVVRETESTAEGRIIVEAHVPADAHGRVAAALASYLAHAGDAVVESAPLADVDWEAVFRRHHHPVLVGRRLAVAPPWDVPDAAGREVIVIEPGQAFGTGQHATTRMCLEEIEAAVAAGGVVSAPDVGTGAGLRAAALARAHAHAGRLVLRLFVPSTQAAGGRVRITGSELRHLRTLRLRPGDVLAVFDEQGAEHEVRLECLGGREASGSIVTTTRPAREPRVALVLAPALLKAAKMDLVVEKATEIGAARIAPVRSRYTIGAGHP